MNAPFRVAPRAPHSPHSSPSPTNPTLDSVIPLLKLESPPCLIRASSPGTPVARSTQLQNYLVSLPCFSSHDPLPIKQQKISYQNKMFVPKTNLRQQLLKVLSKLMVSVFWRWSHVGELLSPLSPDNHYWSLVSPYSHPHPQSSCARSIRSTFLPAARPSQTLKTDPSSLAPSLQPPQSSPLCVPCSCPY